MSTKETVQNYFNALREKRAWDSFLADTMTFTNFVIPIEQVTGKNEYIESTKRFFSMITALEVKDIIIEGNKACALTCYELKPPHGNSFKSDVAEVFTLRDNKINSLAIYFDSSPFPK
jgi:ketosteroid isomerase-like protein